jgi:hypothetical protein
MVSENRQSFGKLFSLFLFFNQFQVLTIPKKRCLILQKKLSLVSENSDCTSGNITTMNNF